MEPKWTAIVEPIIYLLEHGETDEAKESARGVFRDMAQKLEAVREAQKAQGPDVGNDFIQYEVGDYLLIDGDDQVQGVSGNTDFWDLEDSPVNEITDEFIVVKVVKVHEKVELSTD